MGWLIHELTGSAFQVGALLAARALPSLVVSPIAGVASDRMERRKLLVLNQLFLAATGTALAVIVGGDWVNPGYLYLFAVLNGIGTAFGTPVRQALVVNTVPAEDMQNAIALNSTAMSLMRIVGPAIGGAMIAAVGPGANFIIQAACNVAMAGLVFMIRIERQAPSSQRSSPWADMREGFAYVAGQRRLSGLVLMAFVPAIFLMPFSAGLMPVFAKDDLGQEAWGLGMALAMIGIGAIIGTLAVATLRRKASSDIVQVIAASGGGAALIIASQTTEMAVAIPFLMGIGIGQMIFISYNTAIVQTLTPDALRGRVMSLFFLYIGIGPGGGFLAGAIAEALGAPAAMLIGGAVTIGLAAFIAARFGLMRRPQPAPA